MIIEIKEFCEKNNITENNFYGIDEIRGWLYLTNLTSIPEGFNPIVGGNLYLNNINSIPEGFNPIVGGNLYLNNINSISEGFNPTVGGSLYLDNITSIPKEFNLTVGGSLYLTNLTSIPKGFNSTVGGGLYLNNITSIPKGFNSTVGGGLYLNNINLIPKGFNKLDYEYKHIPKIEWQDGKYIMINRILSKLIHKKDNTYKVCDIIDKDKISYIVTDGVNFSQGESIKKAKEDLLYKISNRDKSIYNSLTIDSELNFKESVICYRAITGACGFGVKYFVEKNNIPKYRKYKISEIIKMTRGWYGNSVFGRYFIK
jgi:hypothetical protein